MEPVTTAAAITAPWWKTAGVWAAKNLLPYAASLGASIWGQRAQNRAIRQADRRQNLMQRQMADLAHQRNIELWKMQNEYNTPQAQMARFQAAGLSPHLIYGQGTPGNAAQIAQYQAPRQEYNPSVPFNPMMMLQQYQDLSQKSESIRMTQQQIKHEKQKITNSIVQEHILTAQENNLVERNKALEIQNKYAEEITKLGIRATEGQISNVAAQAMLTTANAALAKNEQQWREKGITSADSIWARQVMQFLEENPDIDKALRDGLSEVIRKIMGFDKKKPQLPPVIPQMRSRWQGGF